jgi:Cu/Ag efflux protein CusF
MMSSPAICAAARPDVMKRAQAAAVETRFGYGSGYGPNTPLCSADLFSETTKGSNTMRSLCTLSLLAACLLASPVFAADAQSAPAALPGAMAAAGASFEATVVAVNRKTRLVTMRTKDNETIQVTAGEEVRNLDQLQPHDILTGKYVEAIALQLKKTKSEAHTTVDTMVGRTPKGKKPGALFQREVSFVADVIAVDATAKTVTVKGAAGRVVDISVKDPAKLAAVKVGDQVEGVFAQSFEIAVKEKAPAKAPAKSKK